MAFINAKSRLPSKFQPAESLLYMINKSNKSFTVYVSFLLLRNLRFHQRGIQAFTIYGSNIFVSANMIIF